MPTWLPSSPPPSAGPSSAASAPSTASSASGRIHRTPTGQRCAYVPRAATGRHTGQRCAYVPRAATGRHCVQFPQLQPAGVCFKHVGGIKRVLSELVVIVTHFATPSAFTSMTGTRTRGVLLHGPPGCGKSLLGRAIAGEIGMRILHVAGPDLVAGALGTSAISVRGLFHQAISNAPCVLFFDGVEALASFPQIERRIVAQLVSCMDELSRPRSRSPGSVGADGVLVLAATNRPEVLDPALRRAGRFDYEIGLGMPDADARSDILDVLCTNMNISTDVDKKVLAKLTRGFVGGDLKALTTRAASYAFIRPFITWKSSDSSHTSQIATIFLTLAETADFSMSTNKERHTPRMAKKRSSITDVGEDIGKFGELNEEVVPSHASEITFVSLTTIPVNKGNSQITTISQYDFKAALNRVKPSAKLEGFTTIADVSWDDVGGLRYVKEELQTAISDRIHQRDVLNDEFDLQVCTASGLLLCGPPGCGKTKCVMALARDVDINFISITGPKLLDMYLGKSENAVRQCFIRARNSAPSILFFDECDTLFPRRTDSVESVEGSLTTQRVVNQFLIEMDSDENRNVFILAASNRPEILDPAVLRPGRLERKVFVGLPGPEARADILKVLTKNRTKIRLDSDVNLDDLGKCNALDGFSGADLSSVVEKARALAAQEHLGNERVKRCELAVSRNHLMEAVRHVRPSISLKERQQYDKFLSSCKTQGQSSKESSNSQNKYSLSIHTIVPIESPIAIPGFRTQGQPPKNPNIFQSGGGLASCDH